MLIIKPPFKKIHYQAPAPLEAFPRHLKQFRALSSVHAKNRAALPKSRLRSTHTHSPRPHHSRLEAVSRQEPRRAPEQPTAFNTHTRSPRPHHSRFEAFSRFLKQFRALSSAPAQAPSSRSRKARRVQHTPHSPRPHHSRLEAVSRPFSAPPKHSRSRTADRVQHAPHSPRPHHSRFEAVSRPLKRPAQALALPKADRVQHTRARHKNSHRCDLCKLPRVFNSSNGSTKFKLKTLVKF